ncbi:MAG: phosphomannomutase/phosphoglucomutase [Candidatus Pacebacteria bacterium]|nr:phosphomannomutase/phosphoglucomutase [Candidatus Paceibacterota bacterium]PIR64086.1 MAG: phosphomannomutase/phosphoglucomutase [Candidatus Pacebacteria bacterium CG10_big_fil_rev_8_21_14_0_10_40_26]PIZ78438.1 MAG: phosphomannomutase/phosphoglucomutase [Candidatus Pacebacteria bacterium CG_4_10_14_0_2_um_filter_40_20]PJA69288.1 MAG: phosphomannomutase/phosphoglucomutase [Candidatus Pacebacteria bacterium CG_4_9_14_3_um_filter_40_12]PJC41971.1 MAG: phosphomannomutase/phosphoglucomutase [Cand
MYKLVSNINPKIFRGYDLRGVAGEDLSADVYYTLGRAYATFLSRRRIKEAAVGRDNRLTGEEYMAAFIAGLNDGGIDTIDMGLSLSQIVYFSSYEFKTKGSAMVTASHNPKEYNGLKLGVGYSDTMITEEIQLLREIAATGEFSEGKGSNRKHDIFPAYKADILKHFSLGKKWKVVVEACNTTSGMFYPEILRAAGCEVIEQNTELDGNFPMGVPDPTEIEVLDRLADGVKKAGADIGFAYDTDGDRMAVVDDKGQVLWMDSIVALFSKDVLDFMPGSKIVYNTLCSRQVTEAIEEAGGEPVVWMTGHSFIKSKLKEVRAPFGGELSGHIFFMDNFYGHDDGAYASLRLLQYLERTNQQLSEAAGKLAHYVSSPEIKFGLADAIKFTFIDTKIREEFMKRWPNAKYIDIDGIRMDTAEEMAIIRASQNGPYITVKFEGKTQAQYDNMKKTLKEILSAYSEINWDEGVNTHALD